MMQRRNLLILGAVFVLLLAVLLLQNASAPPAPPPLPLATQEPTPAEALLLRVFPDLRVLDIHAIQLENPQTGEELTLQRDTSGQWTAPNLEGEVDTNTATNIARTIVLLPYSRSINILPDTDLNDYGFGQTGQFLIQVLLSSGEGHGVIIGALDENDPVYYALVDDRDEIFRIERGPIDFLSEMLKSDPIRLTN